MSIMWCLTIKNTKHNDINSMNYLKSIKDLIIEKFITQDTVNNFPNVLEKLLTDNSANINDVPYIKPDSQVLFIFMKNSAGYPESINIYEMVTTHKPYTYKMTYMSDRIILTSS